MQQPFNLTRVWAAVINPATATGCFRLSADGADGTQHVMK
jgi:hypothetical protein